MSDGEQGRLVVDDVLAVLAHREGPVLERPLRREQFGRDRQGDVVVDAVEVDGGVAVLPGVHHGAVGGTEQNAVRNRLQAIIPTYQSYVLDQRD